MNKTIKGVLYHIGLIMIGILCFNTAMLFASQNPGEESELLPISIYDEENLLVLSLEDVGKYHGDICPCAVAGFRVIQLAISELWRNEIPKREDFEIISALPSQGSQDAFEFITRAKTRGDFTLRLPKGTNIANISIDNWVFIIIRKSTHKRLKIWLKHEVFPEGPDKYFDLRKKVKFEKTATSEDKKAFKLAKQEFKQRLLGWELDKLFGFIIEKDNKENIERGENE